MRILITNNTLAERAGSELYVRDLATDLLRRGHHPIVYSQVLGEVALELRAASVPVVDDLARVAEAPDVIHGHHHLETMTALNWFSGVPAVFVCHGWLPWQEAPPAHPRILRYFAVDELCRQRLVHEGGIDPDTVEVILNFVDLDRFRPRTPLPDLPGRALLLSNHASSGPIADVVRAACSTAGIDFDVAGLASGKPTASPETLLPQYHLVFAKARSALEAMAVGCAVILCDTPGTGPLVTTRNFDDLRSMNFGLRALSSPLTADAIAAQLALYDQHDAAAVSERVRHEARLSDTTDRLLAAYRSLVDRESPAAGHEGRAAAVYIRALAPRIKENDGFHQRLAKAVEEAELWRARAEQCHSELERQRDLAATRAATLESEVKSRREEASALKDELGKAYGTLTWRFRERLLGTRTGRILRRIIGRFR